MDFIGSIIFGIFVPNFFINSPIWLKFEVKFDVKLSFKLVYFTSDFSHIGLVLKNFDQVTIIVVFVYVSSEHISRNEGESLL